MRKLSDGRARRPLARPYLKTVRSKGRMYFYLVKPRIIGGRTIGQKMLGRLSQKEAKLRMEERF